jgi:uncharacterized membrane protein YwaF
MNIGRALIRVINRGRAHRIPASRDGWLVRGIASFGWVVLGVGLGWSIRDLTTTARTGPKAVPTAVMIAAMIIATIIHVFADMYPVLLYWREVRERRGLYH